MREGWAGKSIRKLDASEAGEPRLPRDAFLNSWYVSLGFFASARGTCTTGESVLPHPPALGVLPAMRHWPLLD
jgi:hypothetical protein